MPRHANALPAAMTHGLSARSKVAKRYRDRAITDRVNKLLRDESLRLRPVDLPVLRSFFMLDWQEERAFAALKRIVAQTENGSGFPLPLIGNTGATVALVETIRKLSLAKAALAEKLGFTPASRAGLVAAAAPTADTIDVTDSVSERVIEVGRTRGKTVVDEDGRQTYGSSRRQACGLLIGKKGQAKK